MPVSPAFDITNSAFKANPFPLYAELRRTQPVARARLGKLDAWLISRYDDVLAALKHERLVKEPRHVQSAQQRAQQLWVPAFLRPLQTTMLDQDEPNHGRLRALVHKAFTPRRVEQLQGRIQSIADDLLDRAQPQGSLDLLSAFALALPLTVISELLGVPAADRERFRSWTKAFLRPPTSLNALRMLPALWAFMRYLRALLAARRLHAQDDLLSALVQAEEAGDKLSEDELLAMVFLLLVAGHETTVNLIASGTLALLQNPDQLQRLRSRPELIKPAVEELLRYTSPVEQATERYAREELSLYGQTIRRGELVLAVLASANRDEQHFAQPDTLDLTREPNRHLAFGHGVHFCLGAPLARLEGQIAFNTLLRRLPNLQLAVPADRLRWRATPFLRGLEALPVQF